MTGPTPAEDAALAWLRSIQQLGAHDHHARALLGLHDRLNDARALVTRLSTATAALLDRTDLDDPAALIEFLKALSQLLAAGQTTPAVPPEHVPSPRPREVDA